MIEAYSVFESDLLYYFATKGQYMREIYCYHLSVGMPHFRKTCCLLVGNVI